MGNKFLSKNAKTFEVAVQDDNGDPVTNLATAEQVTFVFKKNKDDSNVDSKLIKTLTLGQLTIDDPIVGTITIPCTSSDLDILGSVYIACQVNYPGDIHIELKLTMEGISTPLIQVEFIKGVID